MVASVGLVDDLYDVGLRGVLHVDVCALIVGPGDADVQLARRGQGSKSAKGNGHSCLADTKQLHRVKSTVTATRYVDSTDRLKEVVDVGSCHRCVEAGPTRALIGVRLLMPATHCIFRSTSACTSRHWL